MSANGVVTLKPKCYTFICLGCGLLAQSSRSDTVTCSPACRVRAHRTGPAAENRLLAQKIKVPIGMMGQVKAVIALRPDLAERIRCGEIEIDQTQREMAQAFWAIARKQAEALHDADAGAVGIDHPDGAGEHHLALADAQEGR